MSSLKNGLAIKQNGVIREWKTKDVFHIVSPASGESNGTAKMLCPICRGLSFEVVRTQTTSPNKSAAPACANPSNSPRHILVPRLQRCPTRMQAFSPQVIDKLKTYVYRLIDPRNGETFYVGKGIGNRVFAHIRAEIDIAEPSDKLMRIHSIRATVFGPPDSRSPDSRSRT